MVDEKVQTVRARQLSGTGTEPVTPSSTNEGMTEKPSGALDDQVVERELAITVDDLAEARELAQKMSLERVRKMLEQVLKIHSLDPNFPHTVLAKVREFLENTDVFENPQNHEALIFEMKVEAALINNNSPYAEVRAVVDNKDDPTLPCATVRAWTIGIAFAVFLSFVNQLFSIRQPPIAVGSNVAQLLAFPLGKLWERWVPDRRTRLFGRWDVAWNPGPFNKKEHMFISFMVATAAAPYTQLIIWVQVLPQFFNQPWARNFWYQLLIGLSTNFIGYGLAGLTRKFLVYPSYCVWPASLVTISLNSALHNETNTPVLGPFNKIWRISRYRFFFYAFALMFVYFWFPNFLFPVLSYFSWMTWIAPENHTLDILTGFQNGLGLFNPWPTFDWNILMSDPLMVPAFSTFNRAGGMFLAGFVILAIYMTNTWNTGYIPILSNGVWNHNGTRYNVTRVLDSNGMYDEAKYMNYSAAYLGAAFSLQYGAFFAVYSAAVTHVVLAHRHEIAVGMRSVMRSFRRRKSKGNGADDDELEFQDVHNRHMAKYKEVSEWWYFAVLAVAAVLGFVGIGAWPTHTSPAVVLYGIALALVFMIPIGVVTAMTGIEVTLNVLAEFIGGIAVQGNALALNFFKAFGYVTTAGAIGFANDLKIAHYVKMPPWCTFAAQMVGTLIGTLVTTAIMQYQLNIHDVCTPKAPMRFFCPGNNTFFTASVLWGTIGPLKVFSVKGQYGALLLGFPIGVVVTWLAHVAIKRFPQSRWLRQVHPVAIMSGALGYGPYSFSYMWPAVPIAWLSWIYIKSRFLGFWSKYNYVLSAAFSVGIAIAGILMMFTVVWYDVQINWWGSTQPYVGCEGEPCTLKTLDQGQRFYPWWNGQDVPAP